MKLKICQINKFFNMKKILFFASLSFLILFSGCSKDNKELSKPEQICKDAGDDPSQFNFEIGNIGFNYQDLSGSDNMGILSAFRKGTEDLYFWLYKESDYSLLCKGKVNIPHTITEDQGYGNIVNLQLANVSFHHSGIYYDTELIRIEKSYNGKHGNYDNYIFVTEGRAYVPQLNIKYPFVFEWYKGSILMYSEYDDSFTCLSQTGTVIKESVGYGIFDSFTLSNWILNRGNFLYLPIDYMKTFVIRNDFGYITYHDFENRISHSYEFKTTGNRDRVDNLKLISNENNIILLECYTTAYSGEKKIYKIKYSLIDNTFEVVQ